MILIDGKATAAELRAGLAAEAATLANEAGRVPQLVVVLVGDDPASQVYVRNKERAATAAGVLSLTHRLPAATSQAELEDLIDRLNADPAVDGILLQLPLPRGLDSQPLLERIRPDKDVDGFHPENVGRLALGLPGLRPCTPAGVMHLLERYNLSPAGKPAVVIGRSHLVGRPLSIFLSQPGPYGDATVTLCHSKTKDLAAITREADFLFAAIGRAKFITRDMVKPGAVVIDVGMNQTDQGFVGDCDFEGLKDLVSAMTPVPGGVGPMTIAMLLANTLAAFKTHTGKAR